MAMVKYAGEEAVSRIAEYVNSKLKFVSSMPLSPETDTTVLYVGVDSDPYIQGGIYKYDGTKWELINSVQTIELTKAEYDLLPTSVQNNGTIYFITDGAFSAAEIDDSSVGNDKTWSSEKINSEVAYGKTAYTHSQIDEGNPHNTKYEDLNGVTTLTGILTAGNTTLVFTNENITDDSIIQTYTDTYGVAPSDINQVENTLTLTFTAQQVDVNVKLIIIN